MRSLVPGLTVLLLCFPASAQLSLTQARADHAVLQRISESGGDYALRSREVRICGIVAAANPALAELTLDVSASSVDGRTLHHGAFWRPTLVTVTDTTRFSRRGEIDDRYDPYEFKPGAAVACIGTLLSPPDNRFVARLVITDETDATARAPRRERPLLQVNESHLALFDNVNIADLALAQGLDCLVTTMSLTAKINPLPDTDILVVRETLIRVPFTESEIAALRRYVSEGGRLLLYGGPGLPIGSAAEAFGLSFTERVSPGPLRVSDVLRQRGARAELPAPGNRTNGCIAARTACDVLVSASDGAPKAVVCAVGQGYLVAVCDEGWSFDFGGHEPGQGEAVRSWYRAVIDLLARQPRAERPERGVRLDHKGELIEWLDSAFVLQYPRNLAGEVRTMVADLPLVRSAAQAVCGTTVSGRRLTVNFNPNAYYAGPAFVGMGCADGASRSDFCACLAHELGHLLGGPMPGTFGEAMAGMIGLAALRRTGIPQFAEHARRGLREWRALLAQHDPRLDKLDLATWPTPLEERNWYIAKAITMVDDLTRRYGDDFLTRLVRLTGAIKRNEVPTMGEWFRIMELAAGADLTDYLHAWGTSYERPSAPSTADAQAALARRLPSTALDLAWWEQEWGGLQVDRSVVLQPLAVGSRTFSGGLGTHTNSRLVVWLPDGAQTVSGSCGPDAGAGGRGAVSFRVRGPDGRALFSSPVMITGDEALRFEVPVRGLNWLVLEANAGEQGIGYGHADWVGVAVN